ncbi:MAG: hypothetical protein HC836_28220 [Richelia sp. RM2_1_2]|nr:hypothetical protein [Richelia sp. SM2_1_7]NJM20319.1 hypothetical protein [Richelia sp. SM1_7_0]NJN11103.1 hypothetical protein [Richelia sp. RM1_1_1]NJO29902.1 hypothetical protein [Richelia sp. SL_2_1]NJO61986.1 hypothetical protein [Richelia sp. RM2_1_2]
MAIVKSDELGMTGTLMRGISPDPEASLRVLLDRRDNYSFGRTRYPESKNIED